MHQKIFAEYYHTGGWKGLILVFIIIHDVYCSPFYSRYCNWLFMHWSSAYSFIDLLIYIANWTRAITVFYNPSHSCPLSPPLLTQVFAKMLNCPGWIQTFDVLLSLPQWLDYVCASPHSAWSLILIAGMECRCYIPTLLLTKLALRYILINFFQNHIVSEGSEFQSKLSFRAIPLTINILLFMYLLSEL